MDNVVKIYTNKISDKNVISISKERINIKITINFCYTIITKYILEDQIPYLHELDNVSDVIDILILVYSKNSNNSIVIKWLQ